MSALTGSELMARDNRRVDYLLKIAKKAEVGMDGEVSFPINFLGTQPYLRLRLFKVSSKPREWLVYSHPADRIERGELVSRGPNKRQALSFVAIHWGDDIDKMIAAGAR